METNEILNLYELTITRGMSTTAKVLIISASIFAVGVLSASSFILIRRRLAAKQKPEAKVDKAD